MSTIWARKEPENFGQALLNKHVAMPMLLVTVDWKLFQIMPTANRFGTARQKHAPRPSPPPVPLSVPPSVWIGVKFCYSSRLEGISWHYYWMESLAWQFFNYIVKFMIKEVIISSILSPFKFSLPVVCRKFPSNTIMASFIKNETVTNGFKLVQILKRSQNR